ncbi:MAG TPA: hypothetical protein ENJ82_06840, partial [Bacteroidetes bacterium]|nr:hypothetical protein [Bacteroidota bacterium]
MTGNNQKKASPDKWKMLSWWLLSFIAPAFMAAFIALILLQKTNLSFEIAMPIMMGVSAIAAIIHYRTLKQPTRTRLFAHGGYAILLIAFSFGLYQGFSIQHDKLLTCPVCG